MSFMLQFLLSHNKILSFWPSVTFFTTPYHLVIGTRCFETHYWSHIEVSKILRIFRSLKLCVQVVPKWR